MAIPLGRVQASKEGLPLRTASTAMPPNYEEPVFNTQDNNASDDKKRLTITQTERTYSSNQHALAIFPQHITTHPTRWLCEIPSHPSATAATPSSPPTGTELFKIDRDIPSLSRRRDSIDCKTGRKLLTVPRDVGSLPRSYFLEDPDEYKVLSYRGSSMSRFQDRVQVLRLSMRLVGRRLS
jgi:hypothetical protein